MMFESLKPASCFRHANDAAQWQDDNCQKSDHVHARFIDNEQSNAGKQQADNQKQLRVHSGIKPTIRSSLLIRNAVAASAKNTRIVD